jgi:hypothetical protein
MQVHAHAFPWEAVVKVPVLLGELREVNYVKFFETEGKTFGFIPGFQKHQRLTGKEATSEGLFPKPPENIDELQLVIEGETDEFSQGNTRETPEKHPGAQEREREREKEKEREGSEKHPDDTPKKYQFKDQHLAIAQTMSQSALKRFPTQKIKIEEWADAVRKLMEIDGHSERWVLWLWAWIQNHDDGGFSWADQIRTPMKLRKVKDELKYFDKLKDIAKRQHQGSSSKPEDPAEKYDSRKSLDNLANIKLNLSKQENESWDEFYARVKQTGIEQGYIPKEAG